MYEFIDKKYFLNEETYRATFIFSDANGIHNLYMDCEDGLYSHEVARFFAKYVLKTIYSIKSDDTMFDYAIQMLICKAVDPLEIEIGADLFEDAADVTYEESEVFDQKDIYLVMRCHEFPNGATGSLTEYLKDIPFSMIPLSVRAMFQYAINFCDNIEEINFLKDYISALMGFAESAVNGKGLDSNDAVLFADVLYDHICLRHNINKS